MFSENPVYKDYEAKQAGNQTQDTILESNFFVYSSVQYTTLLPALKKL